MKSEDITEECKYLPLHIFQTRKTIKGILRIPLFKSVTNSAILSTEILSS